MDQSPTSTSTSTSTSLPQILNPKPINAQKKKVPSPQELISHYTTQGLDQQQASIKVIEDLQNVVFKVIASTKSKKDKFVAETSKKMDVLNNRMTIVDMKLDSKPGYGETFAIGIASGAALNGMGSFWPQVVKGIEQIWSTVRNATDPSSSSNSAT